MTKRSGRTRAAPRKPDPAPEPPENICALAKARPQEAADALLKAHKESKGNSTFVAESYGIAYQTLRKLIIRLSRPEKLIFVRVERDGEELTLEQAITLIRKKQHEAEEGRNPPDADEVRKLLEAELKKKTRQIDIAKAVVLEDGQHLDDSLLSKFRRKERTIVAPVLRKLLKVLQKLAKKKPVAGRQGRRAVPGGSD